MKITLFIISSLFLSTIDAKSKKKVSKTEYLITDAHKAKLGQFPYQASISKGEYERNCGGTLIDSRHVLTAAHCLMTWNGKTLKNELLNSTRVSLGMIQLNSTSKITINSSKIFFLDDVLEDKTKKDIAIIRLESPVKFSKNVKPAKLKFKIYKPGTIGLVSGWGSTLTDDTPKNMTEIAQHPNDLMFAEARIIPSEKCQKIIEEVESKNPFHIFNKFVLGDGRMCTESVGKTGVTCAGDSGGPLTVDGELIGITHASISRGGDYCQKDYPAVFTRVSYFKKWIKDVLKRP